MRTLLFASLLIGSLLSAATLSNARADDPASDGNPSDRLAQPGQRTLPLPAKMPDGIPFRPIGLYQSQLPELIPDHYRPVTIERLKQALSKRTDFANDDQASRLRSSVYWVRIVNGTLISDRSVIDIETDLEGIVRRSLGKINLAIDGPQRRDSTSALGVLPRLESEPDGNLSVVFRASSNVRSGIEFKWRLRGQNVGAGQDYVMRLPRCPQTRIVLSAPSDLSVDALDGVLRSRPGPPPDAGDLLTESNAKWYEIDAGGLTSVRIRTRRTNRSGESDALVVRRSFTQYDVDSGGFNWNSRIELQIPPSRELPPLVLSSSTITSIKINGVDTTYATSPLDQQHQKILIDVPGGSYIAPSNSTTIRLSGKGLWDEKSGWCDLPLPNWIGDQVIPASPVHDIQMTVRDSLQVLSWELPTGWRQAPNKRVGDATVYVAEGPPLTSSMVETTVPTATSVSHADHHSRVRLTTRPAFVSGDTSLLLDLSTGPLQAKAHLKIALNPERVEPIRLQLQPGWSLDSVTLPSSGRAIEISDLNNSNRSLVIWPEPQDIVDSNLLIEAAGSWRRNLAVNTIPPTWFVRAESVRGDLTAAVIAPAELNWSGDTALKINQIERSSLTESQQKFFARVTGESLLFKPDSDRTPSLSLQTPGVQFDVATVLQIQRDGSELIESLDIETDAASQVLPNLTIQTGAANGRPPYRWFLRGTDDASPISLPSSDVTLRDADGDGEYTIDLSDRNLRDRQLVARRRYSINEPLRIQLPSVPKAASQRSEVHLGDGLIVKENSSSVLKIPNAGQSNVDTKPRTPLVAVAPFASRGDATTRLRYDAVKQSSIVIAESDRDPNVTIVWREEIRVIASSRGTDRIEGTYDVSAAGPFQIDYDPDLQLVSVDRDGELLDLITIPQRPITLQPQSKTETIRVVWNRNQIGSSWFRRCRLPRVVASGVKIKSDYRLIASSDTFAPFAVVQTPTLDVTHAIAMPAGAVVTLVRRNIALAIGWLLAALVFSASWYLSRRKPIAITIAVILMITAACLWWPWHLAIVGWLIVPTSAAALLVVSTAWSERGSRLLPPKDDSQNGDESSSSQRHDQADSRSFSLLATGKTIGLLILVALGISTVVRGQETASRADAANSAASKYVNILVPLDEQGEFSSDVVYIPDLVWSELFRLKAPGTPQDARFQSASYRIKIDLARESSDSNTPLVEADYLVHIDDGTQQTNYVRLPIASSDLRRIELIGELNKILQFDADSSGQVVAKLPKGNAFHLRCTLIPAMSSAEKWEKLFLSIPPVASSRLTVESDRNIAALRVGGPTGRLLDEQDLRRWVEEIGPVDSLEVEFHRPERSTFETFRPLERRYWLNIAKGQATIDCEVDPPTEMNPGKTVQLVILDARLPELTTNSWSMRGSELISPSRRLVTLESLNDAPGPVRFLWTQPIFVDSQQADETLLQLQIPEVIAPAMGENAEAWIAIDSDSDIVVAPRNQELTEALAVEYFLEKWSGYRGRNPQRALIAVDRLPAIELKREVRTETSVNQQHHLHVTADQLQLRYTATLNPGDFGVTPRTLRLPSELQLLDLKIDGQPVSNHLIRTRRFNEVALGILNETIPTTIEATAVIQLPQVSKQFMLPQLAVMPPVATRETYTLTRDRDATVRPVVPSSIEAQPIEPAISAASLARGWIPVWTWVFNTEAATSEIKEIGGRFRVGSDRRARFECHQLISLSWIDGQWTMDALIRFNPKMIPDYVDVEIPTRWCEALEVSPSTTWSLRSAIDSSLQVVRIQCDAETFANMPLSIRGRLDDAEKARVAVPNVKVLGNGRRHVEISVPNRLEKEAIRLRTSVVEATSLNPIWKEEIAPTEHRSSFSVASPDWSVELAPLAKIDADAIAVSADAQVFSQVDGALVVCRWDLIPGGLESVSVKLPSGAECLGAWSAGRAVIAEPTSSADQGSENEADSIRVPLSLSRLAQPVEVLIRVPIAQARKADYLPQLIGIPVPNRWLASYRPTTPSDRPSNPPMKSERALALARSAIESVEQSLTTLAELPKSEIATWLAPWAYRYRQLAESADHEPNLDDPQSRLPNSLDAAGQAAETSALPVLNEWPDLDARLSTHVKQYLSEEIADAQPRFSLSGLDGYTLHKVTKLSAVNRAPSIEPISTHGQGLRAMMVNCLTLALVAGLLACLWPFRRYADFLVVHPAFWLGIIGVLGFVVAPIPVAAAIVLAAVTLPVIPYKPRKSSRKNVF